MEPGDKLLCPNCHVVNLADNDMAQECANCPMVLTPTECLYDGSTEVGERASDAEVALYH